MASVRTLKTKSGKSPGSLMAYLSVSDHTCSMDATVFPEAWAAHSAILRPNNKVLLRGRRDNRGTFAVDRVHQL